MKGVDIMQLKIIFDLKESNYKYSFEGLTFVFSSELNMNKFKQKIKEYIKQETYKLSYKYSNLNLNFDLFLSVALYKKIEKRGFLIYQNEDIELKEDTLFLIAYKSANSNHF